MSNNPRRGPHPSRGRRPTGRDGSAARRSPARRDEDQLLRADSGAPPRPRGASPAERRDDARPPRLAAEALRAIRVTCAPALAPFLAQEIATLGLAVEGEERSGVRLQGTARDVMALNLHLRTALHVLEPIASFPCHTPDDLYHRVSRIPWEQLIDADGYVSVVSNVRTATIDNSMFASLRVKDAIVDRIAAKKGRRPDAGPDRHRVVVHLYWADEKAVVSLDTSGEKLADRGYRRRPHRAPMQETLAAAVLLAAGYDGRGPLILPMCGSGTLAIEAALMATARAPGLLRANYAFMHLLDFDDDGWAELRRRALGRGKKRPVSAPIIATDLDAEAIEAARANARTAGVEHLIEFAVCDFAATRVIEADTFPDDAKGTGIVMLNPEYGHRLGDADELEDTYTRIGDFFKQRCAGYTGFVFTGNLDLAKRIGLRTSRRTQFWNADIECRLLRYEMYEGTRRQRVGSDDSPDAPPDAPPDDAPAG